MKILSTILCIISLIVLVKCNVSDNEIKCVKVKNGKFFFMPKFIQKQYYIIRNDSLQMEVQKKEEDTLFFKVEWDTDCIYNLKYLRKTGLVDSNLENDYKNRVDYVEILSVGENYYTFRFAVNSLQNTVVKSDTIWIIK